MKSFATALLVFALLVASGCGWCRPQPVPCCPVPCASPCTPVVVPSPGTSYAPIGPAPYTSPAPR